MKIYRYKVVLFGASCSPFLLAAVVQKHLEIMLKDDDELAKTIINGLYVDNLFNAVNNEQKLIEFFHKTRSLFNKAGLNLRQWGSNSEILNEITKKEEINDPEETIKVLGLRWNTKTDKLQYRKKLKIKDKYTKRSVLETTNSIFDPFGYLIPVEIKCRIFLQNLWKQKFDWDMIFDNLSDLKKQWDQIRKDCEEVLNLELQREIETSDEMELHIFSDASKQAYGAIAYIVIPTIKSQFLMSKARITNIKKIELQDTIPKLEMMGMLLAANLAKFCLEAMNNYPFKKKIIWSDSKVALAQCSASKSNKNTFVHNRVIQIRELCEGFEINYVNSNENPADLTTKPISAKNLQSNELWKSGPKWLIDKTEKNEQIYNLFPKITMELEDWKPIRPSVLLFTVTNLWVWGHSNIL